jgi:hypothetical protein
VKRARDLAALLLALASLLTAAGSFVKQIRGETAQAEQDQNVALTAGELAGEIRLLDESIKPECRVPPKVKP